MNEGKGNEWPPKEILFKLPSSQIAWGQQNVRYGKSVKMKTVKRGKSLPFPAQWDHELWIDKHLIAQIIKLLRIEEFPSNNSTSNI